MRHRKHRQQLGVKSSHREAMMASLSSALFTHGRIQTTLAKAKALRPFAEKVITYAKKAAQTEEAAKKVHYRRLAIARVRDPEAVKKLFVEGVNEFMNRAGGYTRIYKLGVRLGDAAETALIELIPASDEGYKKPKRSAKKSTKGKAKKGAEVVVAETTAETVSEETPAVVEAVAETVEEPAKA